MRKFISLVAIVMIAVSAQAQIVGSRSTTITTSSAPTKTKQYENYSRLYVGFNSISFSPKSGESSSLPGVVLGYTNGISLTQSLPIYLEWGINAQYNSKTETMYGTDVTDRFVAVTVPISATYRFIFDNGIILAPYTGFHVRTNIYGETDADGYRSRDYFDDMEGTRVQAGWQIGGNFSYKKLNIGVEYGIDFNGIWENVSNSTFNATIGINF